ncbi:hypothetical protein ES703_89037 [subsurface metagenome]
MVAVFSFKVLNTTDSVCASCTPRDVILLWSTSTIIAFIITCLPGMSSCSISFSISGINSGGARTRMALMRGSGTKRILPITLLIGISSPMLLRAPDPDHGGVYWLWLVVLSPEVLVSDSSIEYSLRPVSLRTITADVPGSQNIAFRRSLRSSGSRELMQGFSINRHCGRKTTKKRVSSRVRKLHS